MNRRKEAKGACEGSQGEKKEFSKLYKHFGENHNNKDVRIQMQGEINKEITSKLGPVMQININPSYQISQRMDVTNFRETYKGEKVEETDKVYFRKKDDLSNYTECWLKSKVLMTKKWTAQNLNFKTTSRGFGVLGEE